MKKVQRDASTCRLPSNKNLKGKRESKEALTRLGRRTHLQGLGRSCGNDVERREEAKHERSWDGVRYKHGRKEREELELGMERDRRSHFWIAGGRRSAFFRFVTKTKSTLQHVQARLVTSRENVSLQLQNKEDLAIEGLSGVTSSRDRSPVYLR